MLNILKTIQLWFCYCQADIFGPILAFNGTVQTKLWVLVVLCLYSRAVHSYNAQSLIHSYNAQSISRGFRRTFALRGVPRIIWIDALLNITRSGKDITQSKQRVISTLDLKFSAIEFRVTLPKHHEGIGAVEYVIGVIKTTVSKSVTGLIRLRWMKKNYKHC